MDTEVEMEWTEQDEDGLEGRTSLCEDEDEDLSASRGERGACAPAQGERPAGTSLRPGLLDAGAELSALSSFGADSGVEVFLSLNRLQDFSSALREQGVTTVSDLMCLIDDDVNDLAREVGFKIGHKCVAHPLISAPSL